MGKMVFLAFVLFFSGVVFSNAAERVLPQDIIDRCEQQYLKIATFQCDFDVEASDEVSGYEAAVQQLRSRVVIDRLGTGQRSYRQTERQIEQGTFVRMETYCVDNRLLRLIYNSAEDRVLNIWSREVSDQESNLKVTWIDVFDSGSDLSPLGFLYDEKQGKLVSIFDLLREVPKDSLKLNISENDFYTIYGESERHRINFIVFPNKEFVIGGYSVEARQILPDSSKFMEYSASDFERIDGFFFPRKFSFVKKSDVSPGPVRLGVANNNVRAELKEFVGRSTAKVRSVSINKKQTDKDFTFRTEKLNGTRVLVKEVPQIGYIWFNGEIVPRTDENMLKIAMGDHKFMPGVDSYHFWFVLLGFLILAAGLTLKGIELYKKWHEDDGKKDERKENKRE